MQAGSGIAGTGGQRLGSVAALGAVYGGFVLLVALLQDHYWEQYWTQSYALGRSALLHGVGLALSVATALAAERLSGAVAPAPAPATAARAPRRRMAAVAVLLSVALALPLVISVLVLDRFPNSGDEFAFVHQAEGFAEGRLWHEAPPLGATFVALRTWVYGDRLVSQYPPGWPLLMAAAGRLSLPAWTVNPLIGAASAMALAGLLWRWTTPRLAIPAVAAYALTAFYVFNAASYFSHVLTALLVLGFVAAGQSYVTGGGRVAALAIGACLGGIGLTRTYDALVLLLLFGAALLWQRRRLALHDLLIALGGLPFLLALLAYQDLVMGSPFVSTYAADIESPQFRFRLTSGAVLQTFAQLEELVAWTSPLLVAAYAAALLVKLRARALAFYDLIPPLFVVAYFVQGWDGGNRYGPRYYFDVYPVLFVTIATAGPLLRQRLAARVRTLGTHLVAASVLYAATVLPFPAALFHTIVQERQDPYRQAERAGLANAVVVVASSAGAVSDMQPYDLARNRPDLADSVLFANGLVADIDAIRRTFPNRAIWLYEREPDATEGRLRPAP
ncbi:MAG TPA: hypothetical protein VFG43_00795 [Geminicoccaceae bacterium]|nr:hypothetical protein [Geminicoccaceae bacterium]